MLKTKSIDERPAKDDGYRLLITREWPRAKPASFADGFNPKLAPSKELHDELAEGKITAAQFVRRFEADLEGQKERLAGLKKQAEKFDITLVAYPDAGGVLIGKIVLEKCEGLGRKRTDRAREQTDETG
ncbi:MAG: hypothetical protein V1728_01360 [Candidatus Micrarchaeota archaeon]